MLRRGAALATALPVGCTVSRAKGETLLIPFQTTFPVPVALEAPAQMATSLFPDLASLSLGPVLPRAGYARGVHQRGDWRPLRAAVCRACRWN